MRGWLRAHAEALVQTFRQFRQRPVATLLSIVVIGIGLLFPVGGPQKQGNRLAGLLKTKGEH